jgi:hypothetical protein
MKFTTVRDRRGYTVEAVEGKNRRTRVKSGLRRDEARMLAGALSGLPGCRHRFQPVTKAGRPTPWVQCVECNAVERRPEVAA